MADNFPIIEIPQDAVDETEEMGTKEKFWFHHEKHVQLNEFLSLKKANYYI